MFNKLYLETPCPWLWNKEDNSRKKWSFGSRVGKNDVDQGRVDQLENTPKKEEIVEKQIVDN